MTFDGLATSIGEALGTTLDFRPAARVQGGSINECYRWEGGAGAIFVKVAPASAHVRSMYAAEAAGLEELRRADALRVPRVLGVGATSAYAWLALEWIRFGTHSAAAQAALGEQLAIQHRYTAAAFGWRLDNTIGRTPQLNGWVEEWLTFYRERRLRYQLDLAARNGCGRSLLQRGEALLERLGDLFADYHPAPSLLHGDLWGGNWACDDLGRPVIFDPAVYYGDREADLAMTRLFGGFGAEFYAAYEANWGLHYGARVRTGLYNLYHVLNHGNLFGAGYFAQAGAMVERLLAELC
jgi:protein-ribulosamine 3-kinase